MINNVALVGRLCTDVDLRTTTDGKSVANFRIAVDRSYTKQQADFITIVVWGSSADFVSKYFTKGSWIGIEGSIRTRSYEDNNGNKRTAFEVLAREVSFVGGKSESNNPSAAPTQMSGPAPASMDFEEITDDDSLPF